MGPCVALWCLREDDFFRSLVAEPPIFVGSNSTTLYTANGEGVVIN